MKYFITTIFIYFHLVSLCQNAIEKELIDNSTADSISISKKTAQKNVSLLYFDDTELFVYFKGGNDGPSSDKLLQNFLLKNIVFPDSAVKLGIEGTVIANFTITKTGKVSDISIISKTNPILNNEVIRVLSLMPDWVWDKNIKENKRINVKRTLPVLFKK
jgi:TonB family protein